MVQLILMSMRGMFSKKEDLFLLHYLFKAYLFLSKAPVMDSYSESIDMSSEEEDEDEQKKVLKLKFKSLLIISFY